VLARALLSSFVFIALAASAPAWAQDSDEERARRHFETGASLYLEENYEGAAAAFEESYRIRPVPVVLFNLAQTYRRLYRYDDAIEAYQTYLRTAGDIDSSRRAEVRATIEELRRGLAPVTITTDVVGVEIRIDGRMIGRTPLPGPLSLAAGTRVLEATRDGHVTHRAELRVVGGEPQSVEISMPRAADSAVLRIRASVPDATVRIDGADVGAAPVERQLGAGGHEVEVRAAGYETYVREIVLAANQDRELLADLSVERALWERWWFWAAIGGVVAAGLIIGIAAAAAGGQAEAVPGTLGTVSALSWH
jgi:tetratricopeptide (TPR) repeat protein